MDNRSSRNTVPGAVEAQNETENRTLVKDTEKSLATVPPASAVDSYHTTKFGPSPLDSELPDIILDVPNVSVDEICLDVFNVRAHVSLDARVADLVHLNAGVEASIDNVNLTIRNVRANALLLVHLDNVREILDHALTAIAENPILVERLLDTVDTTVDTVGGIGKKILRPGGIVSRTVNMLGETVDHVVDTAGNIVERVVAGPGQAPLPVEEAERRYQQEVVQGHYGALPRDGNRPKYGSGRPARRLKAPESRTSALASPRSPATVEQYADTPMTPPRHHRHREHRHREEERTGHTSPSPQQHRHRHHHRRHHHHRGGQEDVSSARSNSSQPTRAEQTGDGAQGRNAAASDGKQGAQPVELVEEHEGGVKRRESKRGVAGRRRSPDGSEGDRKVG